MVHKVESSIKMNLVWQILIALILGILFGAFLKYDPLSLNIDVAYVVTDYLKPAGDIFIRMIKMIVVPIVVPTIIVGIAGMGGVQQLGRIGLKTVIYFEIITTIAIIVGITLANIFKPGVGVDMSSLSAADISIYTASVAQMEQQHGGILHTIMNVVPTNIIAAMASADMLQIIFFAVLFGLGMATLPVKNSKPLIDILKTVADTMFWVTNTIMRYAPIGVFALISVTVATFGFAALLPLGKLMLLVYGAVIFFAVVVLGITAKIFGFNIFTILKIFKEELILAYSTASSEAVLPKIIEKTERYGAPEAVAGFVVPTGYSFNLDGSTLYQSIAAIFIAQLYGIDLTIWQEIIVVLTLMITSKGIAGVPGASMVVLLATLGSVGIPVEGVAFIVGIDRLLDMARTALNVVGNALAVLIISKWENVFDHDKQKIYEQTL